jgi:hypothetical protein
VYIAVAVLAGLVAMSMVVSAVGGSLVTTLVLGVVVALLVARAWDKRQLRRLRAKVAKASAPPPPRRSVLYLSPVHRGACGVSFALLGMLVCYTARQPWEVGLFVGLFVGVLFDYVLRVALVLIVLGLVYLAVVYFVLPQVQKRTADNAAGTPAKAAESAPVR